MTTITRDNIALAVIEPDPSDDAPLMLFIPHTSSQTNGTQIQKRRTNDFLPDDVQAAVLLPKGVIQNSTDKKIFSYVFQSDHFFLSGRGKGATDNDTKSLDEPKNIVQSFVMSISVGGESWKNLDTPIKLVFRISPVANESGSSRCMYWDENKNGELLKHFPIGG